MNYENKLFLLLLLSLFINSFSQHIKSDVIPSNLIENIYDISISKDEIIDISFDQFVFGNINFNSTINYQITIKNDTEQIFFDFQSEYGCLYITIDKAKLINSSYHYKFCSEGINSIFTLNKNEIIEAIGNNKTSSISGLNLMIKVGLSEFELEHSNISFDYSLKVSARKQIINIIEINSEHKTLCELEKVNENNYRCLFVVIVNESNENIGKKNMVIYSTSQNKESKLNIYADYINKTIYENYDIEYLNNNIPNINSTFCNNENELDFINILSLESNKFIYISVESNSKGSIEIIAQKILPNEIKFPLDDNIQINKINTSLENIYFNFNNLNVDDISFSLVTLYGKASIYLGYDNSTEYMTDSIENKLILNINKNSCYSNENDCKLIIYNLNYNDTEGLDYIFYISYKAKSNHKLKELIYGKSNKILFADFNFPILLYEQLPNINTPININLQIYNIPEINVINDTFSVEILVLSRKLLHQIKLNYSYIENFNNSVTSKFDSILSSVNILLSVEDMQAFDIFDEPFLLIYINNNNTNNSINKLILGSTISQVNSLIYPSERIYHYGKLDNNEKIVYKLKGKSKYHLMRLEFGRNSDLVEWTVKRTNDKDSDSYMKNDTYLSFVTERWINGRGLLTMYIEQGEDIYLTVFTKSRIINTNLTNFVFKYINAEKNDDFQNHIIKHNYLYYDENSKQISINKIKIIPPNSTIVYYLKIINESDYIKNENINTIAIMESKSTSLSKENDDNNILFNIANYINANNNTYYINAYAIIIEKNNNIEYISFSGIIINLKKVLKVSKINLIKSSFIISCCTAFFLLISSIKYCYYRCKYRRYRYDDDFIGNPFDIEYRLNNIDIYDDDDDILE